MKGYNIMDTLKFILFIILIVIIALVVYVRRVNIIHGGNSDFFYSESKIKKMFFDLKDYNSLTELEKASFTDQLLSLVNGLTGIKITIEDNLNSVSLEWLASTGMWKVVMFKCIMALPKMNLPIFGGLVDWGLIGVVAIVGAFGVFTVLALAIIAIVQIVVAGSVVIVGTATAGALGTALIAGIYAVTSMFFNYKLRRLALEKMNEEQLIKVGVDLAREDLSTTEMREFMKFSIESSNDVIKSVSVKGLDIINSTVVTAINVLGTGATTAIGVMSVVTGGGILDAINIVRELRKFESSLIPEIVDFIKTDQIFVLIKESEMSPFKEALQSLAAVYLHFNKML